MKHMRKLGWAAIPITLATGFLRADDLSMPAGPSAPPAKLLVSPAQSLTPQGGWIINKPDENYAVAADICPGLSNSALAVQAMSNDAGQSTKAVNQLRAAGQAGLDALIEANKSDVMRHRSEFNPMKPGAVDAKWSKISAAIDAVAGQRDAYASGLFWYTDLKSAEATARASGKPILSLRLLGNLSDEYSCANSRFFRTVLYANTDVSGYLRTHFILHWQSVRPVPIITIDFGDGRKIRRTITGNSIHYMLTADGTVVDGIPGLYGPKAFIRELTAANEAFADIASDSTSLVKWHWRQADRIAQAEAEDLEHLSIKATGDLTDADWTRIAGLHEKDALLDVGSMTLMSEKAPPAAVAARLTASKSVAESPLVRMVRNFQRSIAEDTVRNQYLFHKQIHQWLANPANGNLAIDANALNRRVYAELFLTPDSDPWLGMLPADTYSALDDDGVCHQ